MPTLLPLQIFVWLCIGLGRTLKWITSWVSEKSRLEKRHHFKYRSSRKLWGKCTPECFVYVCNKLSIYYGLKTCTCGALIQHKEYQDLVPLNVALRDLIKKNLVNVQKKLLMEIFSYIVYRIFMKNVKQDESIILFRFS
jgi:hypothetical protein